MRKYKSLLIQLFGIVLMAAVVVLVGTGCGRQEKTLATGFPPRATVSPESAPSKTAEAPGQYLKVYLFATRGEDWMRVIGEKWPTRLAIDPKEHAEARRSHWTGVGIEQDRHLFLVEPSKVETGEIGIRHLYRADPIGEEDDAAALRRTAKLVAAGQLKPMGK